MKDADLKVIGKAKELAKHTYILTSNVDRFPKKVRHSLVDKMQIKCLEIYEALFEANRINNKTHKNEQCERIVNYMRKFGSITTLQAFNDLGCTRLASRITDLKKQGYLIKSEFTSSKNRFGETVSYKKYSLIEREAK